MRTYERGKLEEQDRIFFEAVNPGFTCTGETLKELHSEGYTNLVVFKGSFTRYGMCRDCGDHYIIARYSRFDRVDKETLQITYDVEDR